MLPLFRQLPLTRYKLAVARILYRCTHLVLRNDQRVIVRDGITYEVDLFEGFDLSLFPFGSFQKHVTHSRYLQLSRDAIVLDVGASFGLMALQYSRIANQGHVHAFEPTDDAFAKLQRNLELNPEHAMRITANKMFVSSPSKSPRDLQAYSSWRVDGHAGRDTNNVHGSTLMAIDSALLTTLDNYCSKLGLTRVDLIKIDTDGHELAVLHGARDVFEKFSPSVIFEIGKYVMEERGISFRDYLDFFEVYGYELIDSQSGTSIHRDNYERVIPVVSTIDVVGRRVRACH